MKKHLSIATTGFAIFFSLVAFSACRSTMVSDKTQRADSGITSVIQSKLEASDKVKARQVEVTVREGTVYLTGMVDTEEARREAGRLAWKTQGVEGLSNDLTVGEKTVGGWIDDVMISSKVKSKLIANSEIQSRNIDVSSSQGVVTLIGRVKSQLVKSDAERIARGTQGVKDVNNELIVGRVKS